MKAFWTPRTNSQRSALAKFGSDWQRHSALVYDHPSVVRGGQCWFIHPVGNPGEARWVPVGQVRLKEVPAERLLPPAGCPDPDWCCGNHTCHWRCNEEPD